MNWTVWQDIKTHTPLSLICSAHTLALMCLSVWPSFYTRLKLKCILSLQKGSQRVQGQRLWFSDTELSLCKHPDRCETLRCTWSPVWVQLKKRVTRRIWGNQRQWAGLNNLYWLLECQCISVRGCWLMLCNYGRDSWPWLQISLPLAQLSCPGVKWPHTHAKMDIWGIMYINILYI